MMDDARTTALSKVAHELLHELDGFAPNGWVTTYNQPQAMQLILDALEEGARIIAGPALSPVCDCRNSIEPALPASLTDS